MTNYKFFPDQQNGPFQNYLSDGARCWNSTRKLLARPITLPLPSLRKVLSTAACVQMRDLVYGKKYLANGNRKLCSMYA